MDTKSLLRHLITGIGSVLVMLGIGKFSGVIDFTLMNFDGLWQAGATIVGAVITYWGYFKGRTPTPPPVQ